MKPPAGQGQLLAVDPIGDVAAPASQGRMEDLPVARRLLAYAFLMTAEFFYGWAWNSVDVLRPAIRETLGLSLTQAGSGYSAQGAGALIGAVVMGQAADRIGRRLMLVIVMVGYGLCLCAGAAVDSYGAYLLQRFVLGLFMGGIFPIVVGLYVGLFSARYRGRLASGVNGVFSSSIIALGLVYAGEAGHGWRWMLLAGGAVPVALAGVALLAIPDQRRYLPFGFDTATRSAAKLPIAELFAPAVRSQTFRLAALTGLNFFAYQAFSGWFTTYLKETRHMPPVAIGALVAWQFGGNIIGCFFWGWWGDRFGRRTVALGFALAAVTIFAFILSPPRLTMLEVLGALYGFGLSSSVTWGPWIAELYPAHLRSTATSIFNWGRLVSFFAPLITGELAAHVGLEPSMLLAGVIFLIAGMVWISLPETLPSALRARRAAVSA